MMPNTRNTIASEKHRSERKISTGDCRETPCQIPSAKPITNRIREVMRKDLLFKKLINASGDLLIQRTCG
jgi:nitrite reductase/ring-hydroxylating ferredoxin subunit